MAFNLPIDSMSVIEKIQAMELLWEDLSKQNDNVVSPQWHQDILLQRECDLEENQTHVLDLSEAKKSIHNQVLSS